MTEKEQDVKTEEQVEPSTDQEEKVEEQEQPEATETSTSDVKEDVKEPEKLADGEDPEAKTIPYSRFKEVNDKVKDLEQKLASRKEVGDDVEDSLLEELFGLKEERSKLDEPQAPPPPRKDVQSQEQETPTTPEDEELDKPLTKRDLIERERQRYEMAQVERHREIFNSGLKQGIDHLVDNYDLSPEEAKMVLDGPARKAYIEAGKTPVETAKFFGERFLKQYRNKVLSGWTKEKKADKAKPKQSDSGGGTPHMARKINSMEDARKAFLERMRVSSGEE